MRRRDELEAREVVERMQMLAPFTRGSDPRTVICQLQKWWEIIHSLNQLHNFLNGDVNNM